MKGVMETYIKKLASAKTEVLVTFNSGKSQDLTFVDLDNGLCTAKGKDGRTVFFKIDVIESILG